jgi:hypothetical protein
MRVLLTGLVAAVAIGLMVYALIDVIRSDRFAVRALPRLIWVLVILIVPVIGALLYLFLGRRDRATRAGRAPVAPDDDPSFLSQIAKEREQNERIRQLEEELSHLDDPDTHRDNTDDSGADHGTDRPA